MDGRRSCRCEQLPAQKDQEEQTVGRGRPRWGESHSARERLRNITTLERALVIRNRFLFGSTSAPIPISQGASKAFSKTGRIWACAVFKYYKTTTDYVFRLLQCLIFEFMNCSL